MAGDERQDHAIKGAVGLREKRRCLRRLKRPPPRDLRDLGHEAGAEKKEGLRSLAQGHAGLLRLDAVLAPELLGLSEVPLATGAAGGVKGSAEGGAHAVGGAAGP